MRRLDPEEVAKRLVAGRDRAERLRHERLQRPTSPELEQALERARAALMLVVRDVESTTSVRERSAILRYDDWIVERAQDTSAWAFELDDDLGPEYDLTLACRFGGHTFGLAGDQSLAEMTADIAFQVQDDITDELWGAWPTCPGHAHPMSPVMTASLAVWVCPTDNDISVPIGELGGDAIPPPSGSSSSPA